MHRKRGWEEVLGTAIAILIMIVIALIVVYLIVVLPVYWGLRLVGIDLNDLLESHARVEQQLVDGLSPACQGQGIQEAAALGGEDLHPIVLVKSSGGRHSWTDKVPREWWPTSLHLPQLVACVGKEEKVKIETCEYTFHGITRYRYTVEFRVVEARTGETVASDALSGSDPRDCKVTESRSLSELKGSHVKFDAVERRLQQYVLGGSSPE